MRVAACQLFEGLNLMGPTSGAVLHFVDLPETSTPEPRALLSWIQGFPFLSGLAGVDLAGPMPVVMASALMALTEFCRLDSAELRILAATATELRLWLPIDEVVVGEVARGGLLKGGLRLQEADVGAMLNILDAHLGNDGIRSREDLLQIKSLVARAATRALVLNADDPLLRGLYNRKAACEHCLVGAMPPHELLSDHLASGGLAALWRDGPDGVVVLRRGDAELCRIPAVELRGAWGGLCRGTVIAAAFVSVMAERMGVAPDLIRERVLNFDASRNPGRAERIESASRSIILSWAGTTEAIQSLAVLIESLRAEPSSRTRILLRLGFSASDQWMCTMAAEACRLFDVVRLARGEAIADRVEEEAVAMILEAGYRADPGVDLRYVGEVHAAIPAFLKDAAPGDPVLVHALDVHTAKACILEWLHTESLGRSEVLGA